MSAVFPCSAHDRMTSYDIIYRNHCNCNKNHAWHLEKQGMISDIFNSSMEKASSLPTAKQK